MILRAHAKINLSLAVGAARADGFHRLRTVFQALALHDPLRFAAAAPGLAIEYEPAGGGGPSGVRLRVSASDGTPGSDVRLGLSQVDINPQLGAEVFAVKVPRDATSITLADVRSAGPVGERR
jgi:hypothetical protein